MTKIILTFLVSFQLLMTANGQTRSFILTYEQNDKWLNNLSDITIDKQLTMLNERILSDTNVFVRQYYPDRIKVDEKLGNRVYGDGKPILIVNQTFIPIDNNTPTYKIVALTKLLNGDNISVIKVLKGTEQATQALYGSNGRSGVIIINAKKNLLKDLKKLKLVR